jgi:site-specific recombinase XerD
MSDPTPMGDVSAQLTVLEARKLELQRQLLATKATSTLRAYSSDLRDFSAYCRAHGLSALPAASPTIASYVLELVRRGNNPSTILRRHASISAAHQLAGHRLTDERDNLLRPLFGTFRRQLEFAPKKEPLDITDLRRLLQATPPGSAAGARDRTLLLLGVAGGLRPSELVALDVGDIDVSDHRLRIRLRRPNSGRWQFGRVLEIPCGEHPETCPVRALRVWYSVSRIRSGPLFRPIDRHGRVGATRLSDRAVAPVIKRAARRAGLDPTRYAGHSLRAGFVVAAAAGGAPERVITEQTGLHSMSTFRRYPSRWSRLDKDAAAYLGL